MSERIGFMQGRLSPVVDGRIQAFPWQHWQQEFEVAKRLGIGLMEWTLDQERLYENPLLTASGQQSILRLCSENKLSIPSLTGDCFMQAPFWKSDGEDYDQLTSDFMSICNACIKVGIKLIVVPLVDNGRLESRGQEDKLVAFLESRQPFLEQQQLKIVFESDFTPEDLARFIDRLSSDVFGINYDIGNSASLGFDANEEVSAYGKRILNVHVKDRELHGTTVPLGTGHADFDAVFSALSRIDYNGNYILQTARGGEGEHAEVLSKYRDMTTEWMVRHGA